jgi:hypothetical protein
MTLATAMLSLFVNLIELSAILSIKPVLTQLVDALKGVEGTNQQLANAIAVINDRTARPNE